MNNKGQDFGKIIVGVFTAIIFIFAASAFSIAIYNASCSNEKAEIGRLSGELTKCNANVNVLNASIQNCSNLIQEQIDKCGDRIDNATKECEIKKGDLSDFAKDTPPIFLVYTLSFGLWIFLSFSLFDNLFSFNISLPQWLEDYIDRHEKGVKIVCWVIWSLTLVFNILIFIWQVIVPFYI